LANADPLDVTHIFAPARAGGLERVVEMLALGQTSAGHRVSVVAIVFAGHPEPPVVARLRQGGLRVHLVETSGRGYRAEQAKVRAILRAGPGGIAHSHGYRADVLHLGEARRAGYATVTTLHGFTGGDFKNRLYEILQRRAVRRADRVIAVSRALANRMVRSGVQPDRLAVVQNAYAADLTLRDRREARAALGLPEAGWVAGFVGRLSAEKGADVLLEAVAMLRDLPMTTAFVGSGREADALRSRAEALGLGDRVRWAGTVDDAGTLYHAFDLFVLSSRTEGTPIAIFEAMSARVPVVATTVGGVPDVVGPGEALLVPAERPRELAAAIREVYEDPEAAMGRAEAANQTLRSKFGTEPWLAAHGRLYRAAAQTVAGW
jgi:glycosyltransferase involved in cell wall biosynthesis